MRLHEDDSHIVAERELKYALLQSAINDTDNAKLVEEAILSALRNDHETMLFIFDEVDNLGEIEDRFIDKLIQREIDKRGEV